MSWAFCATPARTSSFTFPRRSELRRRPELLALGGVTCVLGGLAWLVPVTLVGWVAALLGLQMWPTMRLRLAGCPRRSTSVAVGENRTKDLRPVRRRCRDAWRVDYAARVEWREDGAGGTLVLDRGNDPDLRKRSLSAGSSARRNLERHLHRPRRRAERRPRVPRLAAPAENSALVGFLVLSRALIGPRRTSGASLRASVDRIGSPSRNARNRRRALAARRARTRAAGALEPDAIYDHSSSSASTIGSRSPPDIVPEHFPRPSPDRVDWSPQQQCRRGLQLLVRSRARPPCPRLVEPDIISFTWRRDLNRARTRRQRPPTSRTDRRGGAAGE